MEPFDYLTYKQNKQKTTKRVVSTKTKNSFAIWICAVTFIAIFILVMSFIGSKSSKIDIEYGRFGNNPPQAVQADEEKIPHENFTIDERLFLIQQEEKGPSESKVVAKNEQAEVISTVEFKMIKNNSEEVIQEAEKTAFPITEEVPQEPVNNSADAAKPVMKPKLPEKTVAKLAGALEPAVPSAKVLIGKYSTVEEAREMKTLAAEAIEGVMPFVRKVGNVYTVQIGSYENFDIAKVVAGNLKAKGYDVWIFQ